MKPDRFQKLVLYSAVGLVFIGIGIVPGFFWGKGHRSEHTRAEQRLADGLAASSRQLQELPPAASSEAAALLADPNAPEYVSVIYSHLSDAVVITRNSTAAFLQELQHWQEATQPNATLDVEPFIAVARDVLGYFRLRYSEALLLLLRQFSESGVLVATAVDPDALQQEIQQLLNTTNLNSYYAAVARGCGHAPNSDAGGLAETAADAVDAATGVTRVKIAGRRLLQQHTHMAPAALRLRRRLPSSSAAREASKQAGVHSVTQGPSALHSTAELDAAPAAFGVYHGHSRRLQQQQSGLPGSLQDTFCLIRDPSWPFDLPQDFNFGCPKVQQRPYPAAFQPFEVPVVFHCLRFPSANGQHVLPAIESPEEAGRNLINVANAQFEGSGIRFRLQEVRTDVTKFPYLLLPSLAKWQECSINVNNAQLQQKGLECLAQVAEHPSVVTLAAQLVINVIVGSSPNKPFCSGEQDVTCNHAIWGYVEADGPWFNADTVDIGYQEGDSRKNWVWIRFTELDLGGRNNDIAWEAGGNTFAHELAHYLGLMHIHEGSCEGALPGVGDGVPDTAESQELGAWDAAGTQGLHNELQTWCTRFRDGDQPLLKALEAFNSCPKPRQGERHAADAAMDNVFNLMAYVPEACYIGALTPGQVERLQGMVARHRPRMMDAFKAV